MKAFRKPLSKLFVVMVIVGLLLGTGGLPPLLGGPTVAYASDGLAQLQIKTHYPIQSITVAGVNQNDVGISWPPSPQDYTEYNKQNPVVVTISNWWWRFKWYCPWWMPFCNENDFPSSDTMSPYVWVRYTNGFLEHKRCVPSSIDKYTNLVTCEFEHDGKYVILDAGHGGTDGGAPNTELAQKCGIPSDAREKIITLDITRQVRALLQARGVRVNLTRDSDISVGINSRTDYINKEKPDLAVSIHTNSGTLDPLSCGDGVEALYSSTGPDSVGPNPNLEASKQLALQLATNIHNTFGLRLRGGGTGIVDTKNSIGLVRAPVVPSALIEMAFISNPTELGQMQEHQSEFAQAIAQAILEQLGRSDTSLTDPVPTLKTAYHIAPNETIKVMATVSPGQSHITSSTSWRGSDIVMVLTTPSGRLIDRNTVALDLVHEVGPTYEKYTILNPESGVWEISLFAADVPPDGEDVDLEFTTALETPPPPQLAYVDGDALVLNIGSAERRDARHIQTDEINEEFTVKQLGTDSFSVSAFGLTQIYTGATQIQADGDDGNDTITLLAGDAPFTASADLKGGSGDDIIQSGDGADTLSGGAGNDTINAGGGNDAITGDDGDDTLNGQSGQDTISGGAGNDTLSGGGDADILNGDDGDDKILGDDGSDQIYGDAGADTLYGGAADDSMNGGDGNDIMEGNDGADTMNGGAGNDTISGGSDADALHGDDGDDKILGDDGNDQIYGDGGADSLYGGAGDDIMNGGAGNDVMEGNAGADTMHGDDGNDRMLGQADADLMYGDAGDDVMDGGAGTDIMEGNDGADVMHGGGENDKMNGNAGPDEMYGDAGQDLMYGNAGNDVMHGGTDDDYMEGNQDADTMYGDEGQDDMLGGSPTASTADGGDTMYGGPDHDVLIGDNGTITRPGGLNAYDGSVIRNITLFDVQLAANPIIDASFSGNDVIFGDDGDDFLFGQGGNDTISGGTGNDYLEGNAGSDIVNGDAGQDDIIGGGSANDGVIDVDRRGEGLTDAGDEIRGGDDGDILAGDNARITRPVDGSGKWLIDPNTGEPKRQIVLFDVEAVGGAVINPLTSGSDRMFGDAGKDQMFGQGNGLAGDTIGVDPVDGVDNDRNGRENGSILGVFDCLDGRDNDGNGLIDIADPQCASVLDNNPGGDEMHGGLGDDYMEGNHGSDWMFGDDGEDDILGGSSAGDGVIGGSVMPAGLKDGHDVINGNEEDDVLLGDNAQIMRPVDANGINKRIIGGLFDLAIRDVRMVTTPEPVGAFGNDWMGGGAGVDDMYGQLGNDYMEGNTGEDAMVGDLGKIVNNLLGLDDGIPDPGIQQLIAPNAPFFDPGEPIYPSGSLYRLVELYSYLTNGAGAGNDILYGGAGNDALHGGAGDDILNGNDGDDRLFGGDDSDAIWGGPGHDIMFGGYGIDYLDVLPRSAGADKKNIFPADPSTWFEAAKVDNYQGLDIMYGGWDRDWMQADVSAPGRVNGDRMIDWVGAFNAFSRCDAAYGDWVITRQHSPSLVAFLQKLAQGFGAVSTDFPGTSGFRETAIVFPKEVKDNANPPNPDNPAHFTCGPAR